MDRGTTRGPVSMAAQGESTVRMAALDLVRGTTRLLELTRAERWPGVQMGLGAQRKFGIRGLARMLQRARDRAYTEAGVRLTWCAAISGPKPSDLRTPEPEIRLASPEPTKAA